MIRSSSSPRSSSSIGCFLVVLLVVHSLSLLHFASAVCTGLNLSTEFCCGGQIFPFHDGICCANSFRNFTRYGCCGGAPDSFHCCGATGSPYEVQHQGCCGGTHVYHLATEGCCGGATVMDINSQGCCPDGGVYPFVTGGCCKGKIAYDNRKGEFCNDDDGTIYLLPVPAPTSPPITKATSTSTSFLLGTVPVPSVLPLIWIVGFLYSGFLLRRQIFHNYWGTKTRRGGVVVAAKRGHSHDSMA